MIIKFILLAGLVRLLILTGKPFLCSGIYAAVGLVVGLIFGHNVPGALISAGLGFVLASLYFWLLDYLETASALWWLVALGGILIGLV